MNLVEYGQNYGQFYRRNMQQQRIHNNLLSGPTYSRFERHGNLHLRPILRADGVRISIAIRTSNWKALRDALNTSLSQYSTHGFWQSETYEKLVASGHLCRCECCDSAILPDAIFQLNDTSLDNHLCTNCFEYDKLFFSEYEERYFPRSVRVTVFDHPNGRDIYTYCSRDYAEMNYRYSEYHDCWHNSVADDYYEEDESESEEEEDEYSDFPIRKRHKSRDAIGYVPGHPEYEYLPTLGLELEFEYDRDVYDLGRAEIAGKVLKCLDESYCSVEEDGSLSDGFEVVTGWGRLDMHEQRLQKWKTFCYRDALHNEDDTCGVHVHVERGNMTPLHATKLVWFINAPDQDALNFAVARRGGCSYAKDKDKTNIHKRAYLHARGSRTLSPYNYIDQLNEDRYEKVSFETDCRKTVEFRLFAGTANYHEIMAALEYAQAVMMFTRDVGMRQLTTDDFLTYIESHDRRPLTRYLRQMLQSADFDVIFAPQELTYTLFSAATQRERLAA